MSTSRTPKRVQPAPRWDGSNASSRYANVFQLSADRQEIVLGFGTKPGRSAESGEVTIEVTDRVVLSPSTARRLVERLSHAVRDYEWRHGSLGGEPLPAAEPLRGAPPGRQAAPALLQGLPEQAAALLRRIERLRVSPVLERSFKLFEHTLLANRFLWGFKRDSLAPEAAQRLAALLEELGMPAPFRAAFARDLPEANILFLGFEENERSSVYKAYLEFGDRLARARAERPEGTEPVLIYLGYKWDVSDPARSALARYTCHPGLTARDMAARLGEVFDGHASRAALEIARGIVELAARRVGEDRFLYFETTEDDNPRRSFDINLYNAGLMLEELYPLLLRMCEHYLIPSEAFHRAYAPVRGTAFGHVTGGIDRHGRDFLSLYFGGQ